MNNFEKIQLNFNHIFETLKKNNNSDGIILPFLSKFFFFLYLGDKGLIKNFKEFKYKLSHCTNLNELMALFNDFSSLSLLDSFDFNQINFSLSFLEELKKAELLNLNLSEISAIEFCYIFESLLNSDEKHKNGMYFTSEENIKKAIKPLFLDELEQELNNLNLLNSKESENYLKKISSLKFLDPACGIGNFLIVTYQSLKKLELKLRNSHIGLNLNMTIRPSQFYGIELNPAIASIAKIALNIAAIENDSDYVTEVNNIVTTNALQYNWNELIPKSDLNYIIGNPPFLGARIMNKNQKNDLLQVFGSDWKNLGDLDYVSGWFKKAYDYMKGTNIKASLVATSSICEGLSAGILFGPLIQDGFIINFAYQSFEWTKAYNDAGVYVVIIGFSAEKVQNKAILYTETGKTYVNHINGYLVSGPDEYLKRRFKPLCNVPEMGIGCKPVDGGNYLFKEDEYRNFISKEPKSKRFFVPFYGADELVKQKPRYCLYLGETGDEEYEDLKLVKEIINQVKDFRLNSKSMITRKLAKTPTKFHVTNYPGSTYLALPRISSPNREYIPIGFMEKGDMASDALLIIPDTSLYHFGVLNSKLHMIWLNFVCGRLGNSLRYSKHLVYNNFPWPNPTEEEKEAITRTAENILNIRKKYKDNLKTLYNPKTMPEDLKQAHSENDKAVLEAYHFKESDDENLINLLFKRYFEILRKG